MLFRNSAAQAPSRAQILKRGLIGIAAVLVLAFLASFLGGGGDSGAPAKQDAAKAQQSGAQQEDESAIDTKDLLGGEPDAPSSGEPQRVPASQKFDYSAGMSDGQDSAQDSQDGALTPPSGTAPAAEPIAQPAPSAQAPSGNDEGGEAVPIQDAEAPLTAPASSPAPAQKPDASESAPAPAPAEAAAPAPAPAPAPASAAQAQKPAQSASQQQKEQGAPEARESDGAVLYCGSFATSRAAEEQKALLAFQGQRAQVVRRSGSYTLKLGPYKTKAAARSEFSKLDQAGLVSECALEDK